MASLFLIAITGCTHVEVPEPPPPPPVVEAAPEEEPRRPAPPPPAPAGVYAASHISIAIVDGRNMDQALAMAEGLRDRVAAGESLEALARDHSDDATALRGGRLGVFRTGTFEPAFEAAVAAADIDGLGPVVVVGDRVHVVRRDPVGSLGGAHIFVSWAGAVRPTTSRTRAEADARIAEAQAALEKGEPFEAVASRLSDTPDRVSLGDVGSGQLIPALEQALSALSPGELSPTVESPYGLHILRRDPLP